MPIPSFRGDERLNIGGGGYRILHHNAPGSLVCTTVIPASSTYTIPYHLHPASVEFMNVIQGELNGIVGGKPVCATLHTGMLIIPAGVRHCFLKKATKEDLVFTESTEPWPDRKREFFIDAYSDGRVGL